MADMDRQEEDARAEFRAEVAESIAQHETEQAAIAALIYERACTILDRQACEALAGDVLFLLQVRKTLSAPK